MLTNGAHKRMLACSPDKRKRGASPARSPSPPPKPKQPLTPNSMMQQMTTAMMGVIQSQMQEFREEAARKEREERERKDKEEQERRERGEREQERRRQEQERQEREVRERQEREKEEQERQERERQEQEARERQEREVRERQGLQEELIKRRAEEQTQAHLSSLFGVDKTFAQVLLLAPLTVVAQWLFDMQLACPPCCCHHCLAIAIALTCLMFLSRTLHARR